MKVRFPRRGAKAGPEPPGKPAPALALGDRACCCPARPVVKVMLPPTPAVPHPVDLLLCGHHFRASQAALAAAGATVRDRTGALVGPVGEAGFGRPELADAARRS
jgi:hypothetical protein